ncbi:hypothetical protein EVAR_21127_1 [Eumeta japonica]|uniref:Mariner Mos1 transposase n=1 Tax=Eumeta variegata TaxID=151549 RepID=A0A4C1VTU4_EUMVA|nr:hypothetical protein EVAR_21127_1 [Eumeta japonica]
MIETDKHMTYHEIRTSLSMSQIQSILHKYFGMKNQCSRWIPHNFIEVQKRNRDIWCNAMLTRFNEGASNVMWNVKKGEETCSNFYDPKTKQKSTIWIYRGEPKAESGARAKCL